MINFKKLIYDIVVTLVIAGSLGYTAPVDDKENEVQPCKDNAKETIYDQRQNGTDNIRVSIDGLVFAIAPAESLIAAASSLDLADLLEDYSDFENQQHQSTTKAPAVPSAGAPTPPGAASPVPAVEGQIPPEKPIDSNEVSKNSNDKPYRKKSIKNRLANLLIPLLKKSRRQRIIEITTD